MPALPLLLAVALSASGQFEAGIRTEGRGRWVNPVVNPRDAHAVDLAAIPRLTLRLLSGQSSLALTYQPRFTWRDLGRDETGEQMHEGEARLGLAPSTTSRVDAFAAGALGRTDLVTQNPAAATGPGTAAVATTSTVDLRSVRTGVGVRFTPESRTELGLSVNGSVGGGATSKDRLLLPLDREVGGNVDYGWKATPRDRLTLGLAGQADRFPDQDTTSAVISSLAGWQRRATPTLLFHGGVGAVGYTTWLPAGAGRRDVRRAASPAAEAGLATETELPGGLNRDKKKPQTLEIDLLGRLGATNDRLTGVAAQSLEGVGTLRWAPGPVVAYQARGTGLVTWPKGGVVRNAGLNLTVGLRAASWAVVDLGAYGAWQRSTDPAAPSFSEYGAVVGLNANTTPVNF